uniref:Uncharacterized protein n=1 Tax=Arundo donax TaxID=35708 RepID=A0A0A9FH05_ARUDO
MNINGKKMREETNYLMRKSFSLLSIPKLIIYLQRIILFLGSRNFIKLLRLVTVHQRTYFFQIIIQSNEVFAFTC